MLAHALGHFAVSSNAPPPASVNVPRTDVPTILVNRGIKRDTLNANTPTNITGNNVLMSNSRRCPQK